MPTDPSAVTPDTPWRALDLSWTEAQLPQRERTKHVHGLHPYVGKYPPQLAEVFLRRCFAPGQTVLDPFCGSGTTLVQAGELGIRSWGCDVAAFNALLAAVKAGPCDPETARREATALLEATDLAVSPDGLQRPLWGIEEPPPPAGADGDYLERWYAPPARAQLLAYATRLAAGRWTHAGLLAVVLSRAARSARLAPHHNLDRPRAPLTGPYACAKHHRTCLPTQTALPFLRRYTRDALDRVEAYHWLHVQGAACTVVHGDARAVDVPRAHGVVTSPPYVGLLDYHDQHAYAYALLGLERRADAELGPAAKGASARAREGYAVGITEALTRCRTALPPGAPVVLVVNDRYDLYPGIGQACGLELEAVVPRAVGRRTGMRATAYEESVFVFRAP